MWDAKTGWGGLGLDGRAHIAGSMTDIQDQVGKL